MMFYTSDIKTVSSLLGHTSTRETEEYARIAEKWKENAVELLPNLPDS